MIKSTLMNIVLLKRYSFQCLDHLKWHETPSNINNDKHDGKTHDYHLSTIKIFKNQNLTHLPQYAFIKCLQTYKHTKSTLLQHLNL